MISIVKYMSEGQIAERVLDFLQPAAKKISKAAAANIADKPAPFATPAVYNVPAGQETRGNIFTRNADTAKNIR